MEYNKQARVLIELANKIEAEGRSKEQILATFHAAGILTKKGKFTKNYPLLKKYNENLKKCTTSGQI